MIYKNWSDEFGKRLENITKIPADTFKFCFEYKQTIAENKYICCDDTGIFPLSVVNDRYTHRLFPISLLDAEYLQSTKLLNQREEFFNFYGIKKINNARYDLIVPLMNNFAEHKKSLERIGRCYSKCSNATKYEIWSSIVKPPNFEDLTKQYSKYWENKKEEPLNYHRFNLFLDTICKLSRTYTVIVTLDGIAVACAYFEVNGKELYWHETIRYTEGEIYSKLAIGNYILLLALEHICYPHNLTLNLGVSWFEYKKHWHPTQVGVCGIDFIDPNQKVFTLM